METEADTCQEYVLPDLQAADWDAGSCALDGQRTLSDDYGKAVNKLPELSYAP